MKSMKIALVALLLMVTGSYAELVYSQPFYMDSAADRPIQDFGWTTLNETVTGVVENAVFTNVNIYAIGVGRGTGAPDVGALNATWPIGIDPGLRGYPYMATANAALGDYPTDSSGLYYTTITEVVAVDELGKLSLHQRADNTDSIIRFAIKIGSQWYASAEEFGGQNTGWTLKEMEEFDFTDASKWVEIAIDATSITLGSNPASALSGTIDAYGVFVNTGVTPSPGDHARFDNFQVYRADANVFYVAGSPASWETPSAWSDGQAARAGIQYYVTNGVVLNTPADTAAFPGDFLSLLDAQRLDLMVSGDELITIADLRLEASTVAAGVVDAGEAKIAGNISVVSDCSFAGATSNLRDLRILSRISGSSSIELSAPTKTIYIDNATNSFSGTWVVTGGTAEFSMNDAVGTASIEVQNGTLRIRGDWDGLAKGDSLTVADSATASVDLGAYAWTVDSLTIGTNVIADSTYTATDLNGLGSAVFTGSGTIQVGPPPPPPQPELLIGWEKWSTGTSVPTIETNGITGVITNSAFGLKPQAGSSDGTFGSLLYPVADTAHALPEDGLNKVGVTNISIDVFIENTSGVDVDLGAFHFDALLKGAVNLGTGPQEWNLAVIAGDLTIGGITTNDLDYIGATFDQADYDVDLTSLADHTLDAGGSVVFRLEFTGGVAGNTKWVDMDNVAVTRPLGNTTPPTPPVMYIAPSVGSVTVSWTSEAAFKLQTRPSLTSGSWADVPGGNASPVVVPAASDAEFLRLIQQ